jgi:hypothetical protein
MKHTKMVRKACAAAVMAACASGAMAIEFETESGWTGSLNTTLSAGAAWRVEGIDKGVYAAENAVQNGLFVGAAGTPFATWSAQARAAGWANGGKNQAGKYNYDKGDMFSNTYKFVSDLNFKKGDISGLVRVKGWYDQELNNGNVPWGSMAAGMSSWNVGNPQGSVGTKFDKPLSDSGAQRLSKFDGIFLLDAYASYNFDLGTNPAQVRLGRQAINWGESIFIQGVNQISPIDVNSARRAGSELKEAFLPIWALQMSVGLADGMSMEGFYQFKHEATAIEACGTYWAGNNNLTDQPGACNNYSSFLPGAPGNAMPLPFGALANSLLRSPLVSLPASLAPTIIGALTPALGALAPGLLGTTAAPGVLTNNLVTATINGIGAGYIGAGVPSSFLFEDNKNSPKDSGQWAWRSVCQLMRLMPRWVCMQ